MLRRTFRRRIAPLVALVIGLCACNVRAQAGPPYSKEAIVGMLKGEVSPKRVAVLVRQRGIDFQIPPEVESELRRAGATAELVAMLREIAPTPQPAQIVIQTSPNAQVYLDDVFKGQASPQGRLVIDPAKPGDHALRVSLVGKRDYEQPVKVTAGETSNVQAALADIEKPKPTPPVEPPRRTVAAPVAGTVKENPKDGLETGLVKQSKWAPVHGNWQFSEGNATQLEEDVHPGLAVVLGSETASELTCDASRISGDDGFSVIVSYVSENLAAWWDIGGYGGTKSIVEYSLPDSGVFKMPQTDRPFLIETGRWYAIHLKREGSHVLGTVNGSLLLNINIPDPIGSKGRLGFRTWSSRMQFKNVSIR